MKPGLHPIVGVGALVVERGRILLIRRTKPPLEGRWTIPGGTVEMGETLKRAVVRELREETGVLVRPVRLLALFERIATRRRRPVQHFVIADFLCQRVGGRTRAASDARDVIWARETELAALRVPRPARELAREALALARVPSEGRCCTCLPNGARLLK